jgi:peptidyl-tRNA hydrolase, PTH1 family
MKLIVGLGNPGSKYAGTRHNIGFDVIDYLAKGAGFQGYRNKHESQLGEVFLSEPCLIMKPETFMNLSGRAVKQVVDFYKIPLKDLLVICDDIALPLGKLRAKHNGSHGGQNGLRNIGEQLATQEYNRLRIGVGSPGVMDAADYVLSRFKPGEKTAVDNAVADAANAVMLFVGQGIDVCMNRVNGGAGEKPAKPKQPKPLRDENKEGRAKQKDVAKDKRNDTDPPATTS